MVIVKVAKKKNKPDKLKHRKSGKSISGKVNDIESYSKTIDIREKRIAIVFKVIYVLAIFFAATFTALSSFFGKGITSSVLAFAGASTVLLVVLLYMVGYIINEMKCLKLSPNDLLQSQIDRTEESYSQIFSSLKTSGATVTACFCFGLYWPNYLNTTTLTYIFTISMCFWFAIYGFRFLLDKTIKERHCVSVMYCVSATIGVLSLFLLPVINVSV